MFITIDMPQLNYIFNQHITPKKRGFGWTFRPYEYAFALSYIDFKSDIIVDAGCGFNYPFKKYLAIYSKNMVYSIDVDPHCISEKPFSNLKFILSSISTMPFHNSSVTNIVCISVLEHVEHPVLCSFIEECFRILKPGGKLIVTVDFPRINLPIFPERCILDKFTNMFPAPFKIPKNALSFFHPGLKKYLFCWVNVFTKL